MVFDGHGPLDQRCDGFNGSFTSKDEDVDDDDDKDNDRTPAAEKLILVARSELFSSAGSAEAEEAVAYNQ